MNRDGRKSMKGEALIRVSRVEKSSEINKRACPIIRHLRVKRLTNTTVHYGNLISALLASYDRNRDVFK